MLSPRQRTPATSASSRLWWCPKKQTRGCVFASRSARRWATMRRGVRVPFTEGVISKMYAAAGTFARLGR